MDNHREVFRKFYHDRVTAQAVLFRHRHPNATPEFHAAMIRDFHSPLPRILQMVFRGGAKSTISEEALVVGAGFREFRNCIIIGENNERAAQRLHAIRNEIEMNEAISQVFGDMIGGVWAEDRIVTSAGIMIQAMGRGQSLRGIKHLDMRPDFILLDDIMGRGDVTTPENRKKVQDWVDFDLLPACDPTARIRCNATPLHPEDVPMTFSRSPDWEVHRYPIYYLDEDGKPTATWPDRFPIEKCLAMERDYQMRGNILGFKQEYMVQAEAPEAKPFKEDMFKIEPRVRTWQSTFAFIDPARTVNRETSATTGHAVWSWIGNKMVVWDAGANFFFPDEIVKLAFDLNDEYHPVHVGIELDGLNEFLMQPIRQAQIRRGEAIPVKGMKAPRGKIDFIRGLQPFFQAREIEFAKPLPDLRSQLLGFPTGRIDVPNALAFAIPMRPGAPIYDDFGTRHISEDLQPAQGRPIWLCLNATHSSVTGVLLQVVDGCLRVFADFVREGDITTNLDSILADAQVDVGNRPVSLTAGPLHFDRYNNVGLRQAAAKIPRDVRQSVPPERGRAAMTNLLQRERRQMPMVMVSSNARWVLNGFGGGYARQIMKGGILADFAEEGVYRTLMEGIESFVGLLDIGALDEDQDQRHNATTSGGRTYASALGHRR